MSTNKTLGIIVKRSVLHDLTDQPFVFRFRPVE